MVLAADPPLAGPPPAAVLDPVPHEDVIRAMASDLERLRDESNRDTRNVLLTLARMWSTFDTGGIRSKDAAADWVVERLPDPCRPIVAHSREAYLGNELERWAQQSDLIEPCIDYMIAEIERMSAARTVRP